MMTMLRLTLAALTLTVATACSSALPTAPEPVAAVTFVPTMTTTNTPSQNDRNINVTPETGMIPCDWATVPACGAHAFAACVQHGTGTGQPGPMAHWEWSEWQCFPDSYLPRR